MGRGMIWMLGALALSGLLIFALSGICSNASIFPSLSGYFCPKPRPKATTPPPSPAPGQAERKNN